MFDDLAAYFHENIVESYTSYVDVRVNQSYGRSKDMRAAVVAATALYHLREHIPSPNRKTRKEIVAACPDYDILGDVVNAAKHRELNQGQPKLTSAEDIYEVTVIIQYEDAEGLYSDVQKVVLVKLNDGTERDLLECLTNVMNYWGNEFVLMGVTKSYKPFDVPPMPGESFIPRDAAVRNINTEIIQGVRFKQTLKLLKFDATSGKSEPIDLTGHKFHYRIYKPAYSVDIHLSHPTTGKEYTFELKLGEDESIEWHSLKTDDERQEFSSRLARERHEEIQKLFLKKLEEERNEEAGGIDETDT